MNYDLVLFGDDFNPDDGEILWLEHDPKLPMLRGHWPDHAAGLLCVDGGTEKVKLGRSNSTFDRKYRRLYLHGFRLFHLANRLSTLRDRHALAATRF